MDMFKGTATALVTPFDEFGKINFSSLENLIEFQITNGTDALIILGTTGEPSTMSFEEEQQLINFAIKKVDKRIKVFIGTGSNDTTFAIKCSKFAESAGADGLLVVTPYYNKCTQNGLIKYYNEIADSVNIPIIVYNIKGRTGVNIEVNTMLEIAKHKNIVALKEASGDWVQISAMLHHLKDKIAIYSGDDNVALPMTLLGGSGVISVAANIIPKQMKELITFALSGKIKKANALQDKLYNLFKDLFIEVNPIPVKYALNKMGLNAGTMRSPLTEIEDCHKKVLDKTLKPFLK